MNIIYRFKKCTKIMKVLKDKTNFYTYNGSLMAMKINNI